METIPVLTVGPAQPKYSWDESLFLLSPSLKLEIKLLQDISHFHSIQHFLEVKRPTIMKLQMSTSDLEKVVNRPQAEN